MKWLATGALLLQAVAAQWSVKNGQVSVIHQGHQLSNDELTSKIKALELPSQSSLELTFETNNGAKSTRAHQTLALITDESTGLQFAYPATNVKPNGKAKISIAHKSIPAALQNADKLTLSLLVGSVDTEPVKHDVTKNFQIKEAEPMPQVLRMEAKPEIVHQFKPDPKRVAAPIALFFAAGAAVLLAGVLGFFGMTASVSGISTAVSNSPLGHLGLLGSLFAFEAVFFLYYRGQSVFDTLTAIGILAPFAVYTGSRALRELRHRREKK